MPVATRAVGRFVSAEDYTAAGVKAIIANALQVFLYQNWTNVDGFFTADPKVVVGARPIVKMNYNEASIMASAGANVLHEDTVLYLQKNE